MISPESIAEINRIRAKAADGSATAEDFRRATELLRQGRVTAAAASDSARRKTARAAIPSAEEMLGELGGL